MDCNISEQKFYKLKGKPWSVLDWPYNESERSPPDIGHESSKRGCKEYMDNLLPGSMKRLYGVMPALETLAIARCPACSYICKVQCLPAHFKCDRNKHLVCRTSDLMLENGEVSREKSCGPFYEISWNKCQKKLTEVIEQSKSVAHVPKQKDSKSHSSRSHSTYSESDRSSHSKSKSSSHSSSSNRDKEKSSKSSTVHRSSSSSSRSKSGHNSHKKDKHKSASGSSSSHSKRRDEKSSVEIDGSSSKSKSSSSKDRHERTSKSRSEKSSSSKDRSDKSSSSKDRSEKSSSSKDRSEKSSSKDKSDKHSSRDRSERSSSSSWSKSSKSSTKLNPSQGSYTLSIPSSDTGQNETVESLLFSNSVIGGPPNQVMKIIATSTGSDKNKGDKTEYEQLKFYADSTDRRSKLSSETDRHDNSTATGNSTNFKIPLKSKASSSSSVNLNNDSYVKKAKPSLKPSESYASVKSPSKSPSGNSVRSSGVESGRSSHAIPNSGATDQDALDGKLNDSKSKLTSVTSHASNGSFKILLQGKSGSPTHVTQGHHDSSKRNRSVSKPLEKAPTKPLHKSSTPLTSTETKSIGVSEPDELEKQNAALKSSSVTHVKKKKKKKEKDCPRKIIPLKERSFNPDLHCGVHITGDSRPCTRSLTCKTHSIALRRAVAGRSNPFDVLLQAHRKARDEEKNAKSETTDDKLKIKKPLQNGAESMATNSSVELIRDVTARETLSLDKSSLLNSNDQAKITSSLSMPALESSDVMSRLQSHRTDPKVDGINGQTFPLGRSKPHLGVQQPRDMLAGSQLPNSSVPQTIRTDLTLKDYLDTKSSWSEGSSESSSQNNSVVSTDNLRKLTNSDSNTDVWSEAAWENTGEHDPDVEIISSHPANNLDDTSWRRSIPQQTTEKEPRTASELFQARNRQNARAVGSASNSVGSNQERPAQAVKYLTPACTIAHANWVSIYDHNLRHLKNHMAEYARTCGCYSGQDPDPSLFVHELNNFRPGAPTDGVSLFDLPMDSAENNFVYITDCKPGRRAKIPGLYRPRRATLRLHNCEGEESKEVASVPTTDLIYSKKNEDEDNQIVYLDLRTPTSMDGDVMIVGEIRRSEIGQSRKRPLHPADVPLPHKRLTDDGKGKTSVINITASFPEYCEIPLYDDPKYGCPREGWTSSRVFLPDERAQTEVHSATQALAIRTLKSFIEKPLDNSDIFHDSNSAWLPDAYDHTTMIPK